MTIWEWYQQISSHLVQGPTDRKGCHGFINARYIYLLSTVESSIVLGYVYNCTARKLLTIHAMNCQHLKVRLHGRRQTTRLARDILQRDLPHGNSVYMVGSCRTRLLHIIHVSAVSEVGVLQANCSRQPVLRGNFMFKLKLPPGHTAVARLLPAACRRVNAPVLFLCFYFAARLSHPVQMHLNKFHAAKLLV